MFWKNDPIVFEKPKSCPMGDYGVRALYLICIIVMIQNYEMFRHVRIGPFALWNVIGMIQKSESLISQVTMYFVALGRKWISMNFSKYITMSRNVRRQYQHIHVSFRCHYYWRYL
jgi:hypothetical protein